ncbi:MAG: cation diffusion facilitator family transporter [Alphaproteobacteria bacterium]
MPRRRHSARQQSLLAWGSVVVALSVMGLKYGAYMLTGSVALYSDALESLVNVATAIATLIALKISAKPADNQHPYGHHKAEYFSAVLEGVMIIVAALLIFHAAYMAFFTQQVLEPSWWGMGVNALAGVANGGWAMLLMRFGRKHRSPALVADGRHLLSDVWTSVAVLLGLGLALATGLSWLDPLLAALVAFHILGSGARLVRESLDHLLDHAVDENVQAKINAILVAHSTGALEIHALRTRVAGRATFIEFHLIVPSAMTVADAHLICDRLEEKLHAAVDGAQIQIHIEPEHERQHKGIAVLGLET